MLEITPDTSARLSLLRAGKVDLSTISGLHAVDEAKSSRRPTRR